MADDMTFSFLGDHRVYAPENPLATSLGLGDSAIWNTFFACRRCQEGVVVKLKATPASPQGGPADCEGDVASAFEVIAVHPRAQRIEAPGHVPDAIARNCVEAADNGRRRLFTSAAMMFRKVLDRATRELAPADRADAFRSMSLQQRIDALAEIRALTPTMRDWAHLIRLEGNEAAHDADADEATAAQLHAFAEVFLIYAFTLPEKVRRHAPGAAESTDS